MRHLTLLLPLLLLAASPAQAYVGPGAGLGAIVATLAVVLAIVLLIAGFLWFPIKRALRKRRAKTGPVETSENT